MLFNKELKEMEFGKLGNAIRSARMKKGLSQEELAEKVNVTPTHIKHIESEHRKPSIDLLWSLVETLNISLDSLLISSNSSESEEYIRATSLLRKCNEKQLAAATNIIGEILKLGS